ncbi:iron uptake transporter deferrochelatase/peroxidase subunit [Paenibacillus sp. CF384]|uniref:iron uptake transporter deferrochelatase/peroxidase subunit n=1 Tax=Paenibacillus sp. CF384 TaxID=1884382 RepID=UPI00089C19CC|nr:iron uptake transporter deferrochelatase/peroxidase subunit [Paenibacillus sp. CF384]SDX13005.1 deferrochelatase/peroxidase EfeB [Paenibacillus sp. CF384]
MKDQEKKNRPEEGQSGIWKKPVSRRDLLKMAGIGGAGLLLGGLGTGGLLEASSRLHGSEASQSEDDIVAFYGPNQAGIATPSQDFICFAAFDLRTTDVADVRELFKKWTEAASAMTRGQLIGEPVHENEHVPPTDTGEAAGLNPSRTTITFGVGPSFFDERFGLAGKRPASFAELPLFNGDALREEWTGGDIGVQVCANDLQVAFHAIRNLARIARGKAVLRWTQEGFQRTGQADPSGATPRNLMGFKDGTGNPDIHDAQTMKEVVWAGASDGAPWMAGGSYMVVRRIRIRVEVWDRSTLKDQEDTFGRNRHSGAPLGSQNERDKVDLAAKNEKGNPLIPMDSHVRLARGDSSIRILRRSYSYSSGLDNATGQLDAGLLFISYQRDIAKQFIPMQQRLATDKLNEYILHHGSAVFACFPGVRKGGYIGDTLL